LAPHVRARFDEARGRHVLLGPESVMLLNATGADIVALCDGRRTVAELIAGLRGRYRDMAEDEVPRFLARLVARRCVTLDGGPGNDTAPSEGPGHG
jgi:pyrroloquinoline quinone biosynthesis protein D